MPFKVYGHGGKPVIVFPSSGGRFYEYEDFKMIEAVKDFIQDGKYIFYTVDSVDNESWLSRDKWPGWSGAHAQRVRPVYYRRISSFRKNFIQAGRGRWCPPVAAWEGTTAQIFIFRHPDVFDTVIALSGIYDARFFVGDDISDVDVLSQQPGPLFAEDWKILIISTCSEKEK